MRPGFWQFVIIFALVFLFFGGRIIAVIRKLCHSEPPPPPPPRRPSGRRKVPASEDIVDAEIIDQRDR